jgi:hypothetical protein
MLVALLTVSIKVAMKLKIYFSFSEFGFLYSL